MDFTTENPLKIKQLQIYLAGTFLFLLFVLNYTISAQVESDFVICGSVSDSISGERLPYASVQLISEASNLYSKSSITDFKGNFCIENIPGGEYQLLVSFMGYKQKTIPVLINKRKIKTDIFLEQKEYTLEQVEITSEKEVIEHTIEKTTINVSRDITVSAGNAVDIMQTLPSIDFDVDGNLQYRGSNRVTILLNGKRSELVRSLEQIPADQVDKIEIINNPSSKYDAEGMSGIINIVLKTSSPNKNKLILSAYAGFPETYGGNAGYSAVSVKSNLFITGGYNRKTLFQTKEHLRKNYENPDAYDYYQYDREDMINNNLIINTNYDYAIDEKQEIGISLVATKKFDEADRSIEYKTLDDNGVPVYESFKDIDISLDNYTLDGNLDYLLRFKKTEDGSIKANLHYTLLDQLQEMNNRYYFNESNEYPYLQNTYSFQLNQEIIAAADYTKPLRDSIKFDAGYQFNYRDLLNNFSARNFDYDSEIWEDDTVLNNRFNYLQYIHSAYIDLNAKLKFINVRAGLRAEHTLNKQNDSLADSYFNLFPSILISSRLNDHFNVYIAYSRRINRPTIKMLNPFTDEYADILNMHIGNPDLKPEYVNSFEAGSQISFEKLYGSASVYYRFIDQAISRVKSASNDSALLVTFMNLDRAHLLGGELSISIKPLRCWSFTINGNVFYTNLKGQYGPNQIDRSMTGWTLNIANQFKLPVGFGLQVNGYYKSKLPDVMGTYQERYYWDLAIRKNILKDRGKLVFRISDVFNTYRYGLDLVGVDEAGFEYSQRNRRKNESQYFILSFTYNIDGKEKKQGKSKFYLESFGK